MIRNTLGRLTSRAYLGTRYVLLPAIGHEIMRRRSPQRMLSQWPEGTIPLGPRVCVFVHWDRGGEVRDHVLHQVTALAEAGVSVVFVTNSGFLRPDATERLKAVCAGIIVRANVGYDFGAWREGFERLDLPRADTQMVIMANDSVYGPLWPVDGMLATMDFSRADVWGCTESWQSRYHLQSYFMAFSPAVVASLAWRNFWDGVRPTWSKNWLIRLYEIGLTQTLLRAGFKCRAVWPYPALTANIDPELLTDGKDTEQNLNDPLVQVRRSHAHRVRGAVVERTPLNPTSDLWRQLLAARCPFIKRELLRDNPTFVLDVGDWRTAVAEYTPAGLPSPILAAIERDLQRTLKNRTP